MLHLDAEKRELPFRPRHLRLDLCRGIANAYVRPGVSLLVAVDKKTGAY